MHSRSTVRLSIRTPRAVACAANAPVMHPPSAASTVSMTAGPVFLPSSSGG